MGFEVFEVSLEIVAAVRPVLERVGRHDRSLADQMRRAAASIPLNVAEGNRRQGGDRLQLFRVAAGSADELRSALRVALAWGYVEEPSLDASLALLDRSLAMLWRLTKR